MLTVISGTNRPDSATRKIVRHLEGIYQGLGQSLKVLDLQHLPSEAFHAAAYAAKPAGVQPFIDDILHSHGLIVVTPEYNGGVPGVLKYFIDLLPFPKSFEFRPVCFVGLGAGEWGALRPVEQLQGVFGYRNAFIYPERVFIRHVHKVLNDKGELIDPEIDKRLRSQAQGFVAFSEALRPMRMARGVG
jgi:chromate reductase